MENHWRHFTQSNTRSGVAPGCYWPGLLASLINRYWLEARQEIQASLYWGPCFNSGQWKQVSLLSCSLRRVGWFLTWGEGRGVSRGKTKGWLQCFACPWGGVVCRGHMQGPVFLLAVQKWGSRHRFDPSVGKIPWKRAWQLTLVFLSGESHGQGSLEGYSPWGLQNSWTQLSDYTTTVVDLQYYAHLYCMAKWWVICICILFHIFSIMIYTRILNIVPCAIGLCLSLLCHPWLLPSGLSPSSALLCPNVAFTLCEREHYKRKIWRNSLLLKDPKPKGIVWHLCSACSVQVMWPHLQPTWCQGPATQKGWPCPEQNSFFCAPGPCLCHFLCWKCPSLLFPLPGTSCTVSILGAKAIVDQFLVYLQYPV